MVNRQLDDNGASNYTIPQEEKMGCRTIREPMIPNDGGKNSSISSKSTEISPVPPGVSLSAAERKQHPIGTGVLDYFPDALMAVAKCSWQGNNQHNPGQPLHWAREKSTDQADCVIRHFLERGTMDSDGIRHSAKMAWRALALLQLEIEKERGA